MWISITFISIEQRLKLTLIVIHGYGKDPEQKVGRKPLKKIYLLIDSMNQEVLCYLGIKLGKREEYAIDYVNKLMKMYKIGTKLDESTFVYGGRS